MDQQPSSSARPSVVTTVAILLFIRGGFSILGGIIAITGGSFLAGFGGTGTLVVFGIIAIIVGAVEIWAGTGVLKLQEQARLVALAVVGIDAALTLIYLVQARPVASSAWRWTPTSSGRSCRTRSCSPR